MRGCRSICTQLRGPLEPNRRQGSSHTHIDDPEKMCVTTVDELDLNNVHWVKTTI